jgi:hypothetical protein
MNGCDRWTRVCTCIILGIPAEAAKGQGNSVPYSGAEGNPQVFRAQHSNVRHERKILQKINALYLLLIEINILQSFTYLSF